MLTLIEVWAHLNRRHAQNCLPYRPSKSHYRVEKYTEIPDIIYTQMQHLTGRKVREAKCPTGSAHMKCLLPKLCSKLWPGVFHGN